MPTTSLTFPSKSWKACGMTDKKFLVDTSAWILSFKTTGQEGLKTLLKEAIERDRVVTTPVIALELL